MDSLELGIRDALANLCADPRVSEPGWDWHGEAIRAVGEVAQRAGHIWLPNLGAPAWLWDGVALERGSSTDLWSGALVGIPLVLEVDWGGRSDVLYDFKKLLVARAEHRVMVSGTRANRS